MSQSLTKNEAYSVALEKLKKKEREDLEAKYSSVETITDNTELEKIQKEIIDSHLEHDRFQVYQISMINEDVFDSILSKAEALAYNQTFLISPSILNYSEYFTKISDDEFEITFAIFTKTEIKEIVDGDTVLKQKDAFLVFKSNFKRHEDKVIITNSFPRFKREYYKIYGFSKEVEFIQNWITEKLATSPLNLNVKEFFESLQGSDYDKRGFEVEDLKNEGNNEFIAAGFKISTPVRSDKNSSEMYKLLDDILVPEITDSLMQGFQEQSEAAGITIDDTTMDTFFSYLSKVGLSSEFFNLLHQACEYGIGNLRYLKETSKKLIYKLEYKKNSYGLIRVSHMGWSNFEPIFKEIKTFS